MNLRFFWHQIGGRIGFYTIENASTIPELPGIYAWFLPLYIINEDLEELLSTFQRVYLYDAPCAGIAISEVGHEFNWDTINVRIEKHPHGKVGKKLNERWNKMLKNKEDHEAFKSVLMEASLLMPPLYVGKSDNLRVRYDQHLKGTDQHKGDFHKRFTTYAESSNIPVVVSDLLFVCIQTETDAAKTLYGKKDDLLNKLLEQVIMKLARPPFSMR